MEGSLSIENMKRFDPLNDNIPTSSGSFIKFQRSASVSLFNSGKNFSGTAQPKRYIFSAVVFHLKVSLDPELVSHYHNQYGTKLEIQSSATQIEICNLNINETTSLHCPSKIRVQTMHMAWLLSRRLCFFRWSSSIRSRKLSLKNGFNSQHRFCRSKIKPWGSVCAETSAGLHVDSLLHRPDVRLVSIRDGQINIAKNTILLFNKV